MAPQVKSSMPMIVVGHERRDGGAGARGGGGRCRGGARRRGRRGGRGRGAGPSLRVAGVDRGGSPRGVRLATARRWRPRSSAASRDGVVVDLERLGAPDLLAGRSGWRGRCGGPGELDGGEAGLEVVDLAGGGRGVEGGQAVRADQQGGGVVVGEGARDRRSKRAAGLGDRSGNGRDVGGGGRRRRRGSRGRGRRRGSRRGCRGSPRAHACAPGRACDEAGARLAEGRRGRARGRR
jgi:hypothetical protein